MAQASKKKRVLIADDVEFLRAILKDILSRAGFDVIAEAEDGVEALRLAKELKPDIVVLDIVMPGKNGLQVAGELRGYPLKVVMCSTIGSQDVIKEAMELGASAYIVKPLDEKKVLAALEGIAFEDS